MKAGTTTRRNKKQDLTEREKAVLIWAIVEDCNDNGKIYLLSRSKDPSEYANGPTLTTTAARWMNQYKVQKFVEEQTAIYKLRLDKIKQEARAEALSGMEQTPPESAPVQDKKSDGAKDKKKDGETKPKEETQQITNIDFTNIENALQELNRLANQIPDAKSRADAITTIQKLIAQTRPEEDSSKEIQRFYTPLSCKGCVLYQKTAESQPEPEK